MLANIRNQPVGGHTLAALNLPESFLRREADRVIRSSFEERARIIVKDPQAQTADGHAPAPPSNTTRQAAADAIITRTTNVPNEVLAYRQSLKPGRPGNRGFKPSLHGDDAPWPLNEPADNAPAALRAAADMVATRLAFDGLLPTLAQAIVALGPEQFTTLESEDFATLRAAGLPIDLLRHFTLGDGTTNDAIVVSIAKSLHESMAIDAVVRNLATATFAFQPTQAGFAMTDDSGGVEPGVLRIQMTRGGYWRGEGDGGTADMLRQVMNALPQVPVVASIEQRFVNDFVNCAATWPLKTPAQLTLVAEPARVAQWTQDNAKSGVITTSDASRLGMLVPRYASSNDDGSVFLPDETFLLPGVAAAIGAELVHSPLLFQGGNILCVRVPTTDERLLLVSDADVYRNTALGLSIAQILEAFRIEFGCDRCEMLEAVSFHLDYDMSVRAMDGRLIALVNDPLAAARIVLEQGMRGLVAAEFADDVSARMAIDHLHRNDDRAFLELVAPVVYGMGSGGGYPLSVAERFAVDPMDSGVGNMQRFLLALDLLVSHAVPADQLPPEGHARSYLLSFQRREREREALHQQLRDLGMEVVAVPSMSDALRSIAALNGLQLRGMYIMPAYGGLYTALDAAAQATVAKAFGEAVRIVPIACSESQRRSGAVRCSLSVFPRLTSPASMPSSN